MRGREREVAILQACMAVLVRDGYQGLTIDAVAAEAHASKATIYRRWTGKPHLVRAALDQYDVTFNANLVDTGDLRSDLFAVVEALRRKANEFPITLFAEFVELMKEDDELAETIRRHLAAAELSPLFEPLKRAVARRDIGADIDQQLLHDVVEAMVVHRLQLGHPLDDAFATKLIDRVIMPLIRSDPAAEHHGAAAASQTWAPNDSRGHLRR